MPLPSSLLNNNYTKITLGASFNDVEALKRIVFIYSIAGADCFDIGARVPLVEAAREAVDEGFEYCRELSIRFFRPRIIVSVDLSDDPHFRKAVPTITHPRYDANIRSVCLTQAIEDDRIIANLCIGCGKCIIEPYPIKLVEYSHITNLDQDIGKLLAAGADGIEYHIGANPINTLSTHLTTIKKYLNNDISFSIGSGIHDAPACQAILDYLHKQKIRDVIIQADGKPMSANAEYNSSLDSVLLAKEVMEYSKKKRYKFYFQLSGGTNQYSRRLSNNNGILPHGIGWGSWARKVIADTDNIEVTIAKAKGLLLSWRR